MDVLQIFISRFSEFRSGAAPVFTPTPFAEKPAVGGCVCISARGCRLPDFTQRPPALPFHLVPLAVSGALTDSSEAETVKWHKVNAIC